MSKPSIRIVDPDIAARHSCIRRYADCVMLTKDGKILLQYRGPTTQLACLRQPRRYGLRRLSRAWRNIALDSARIQDC